MRVGYQRCATCLLAMGFALGATCTSRAADDKPAPFADASAAASDAAATDEESLVDPAFDRYVNMLLLGKAWNDMDAGLLVDVALQLAEGERVLQRSHRAISAEKLLELATHVAVETNDEATLERLAKVAKARDDQELTSRVAMAGKLAGKSRDAGSSLTMAQVGSSEYTLFRNYMTEIRGARIAQDTTRLDRIAMRVDTDSELSSLSREELREEIQRVRSGTPEEIGVNDWTRRILNKLQSANRAGLLGFYLVPDPRGMLITNFIPGTSAGQLSQTGELQVGDVVLTLAGRRIYSVQDIYAITDRTPAGAPLQMEMLTRYNEPYWIWISPSGSGGVAACRRGCGRPIAGGGYPSYPSPGFGGSQPAAAAYAGPGQGGPQAPAAAAYSGPGQGGFPAPPMAASREPDPTGPVPAQAGRSAPGRPSGRR